MRREIFLIFSIALLLSSANVACAAELSDPSTWSTNDIKAWLGERNIPHGGIPEKLDLVELIKVHWGETKEQAKDKYDKIEKFVKYHVEWLNKMYENPEVLREKLADQYESVRQYTDLTKDQAQYAFNSLKNKVKERKDLAELVEQIRISYASVTDLIKETTERVQRDLENSKEVSQGTIDWFKGEVNKLREPEANLVLQGVQEKFAQRKIAFSSPGQAQEIFEKLGYSIKDSYQSVNSSLERLRKELAEVIGGKAENVIEELKSQFSTVNDYRIISQEKIQSILDQIGQKLQDGKAVTFEQLQNIKEIFTRYAKYYYDAATGKAIETKEEQQERTNRIIESIKEGLQENRERGEVQLSKISESIKDNVKKSQQLTERQTEILSDFFIQQFENVQDARELTEDKMSSLMDALKIRLEEGREYFEQGYEKSYNKVQEGYEKAGEGYSTLKEKMGSSPQPHPHKDEL